ITDDDIDHNSITAPLKNNNSTSLNLSSTPIKIESKKLFAEEILYKAGQEITKEISGNNNIAQICNIFMTSVTKALELEHMIICFYNHKSKEMMAKMGLGITDNFLKQFSFSLKPPVRNLFQVASLKGVDIYINDTQEYESKTNLPAWYRQIIDAETFMLFPVSYNNKPFALFYLDKNRKNELLVGQENLKKLQALRALCVKSIEKRYLPS
ncbi:MAG: hypothetical protein QM479_13485, partial [Pseudomonadota bacterium]